jgi:hypothetical protein
MLESVDGEPVALVEQRDQAAVSAGTGSEAAKMDGSAGNLVKAAGGGGSGSFKLDPAAAAQLAAACQTALDHIRDMTDDLSIIEQAPKLGSLQGAKTVADYTQNVATDPQGMLQAIQSLQATLIQMHDAYIQASTNYQETNEQIVEALKKIDPDYKPTSTPAAGGAPVSPSTAAANQNFN